MNRHQLNQILLKIPDQDVRCKLDEYIESLKSEANELQDEIYSLQGEVSSLTDDLETADHEINELKSKQDES